MMMLLETWLYLSLCSLVCAFLRLGGEDSQGPVFTFEPPDRVDFSNTTGAKLDCAAVGKPEPLVTWTRADESLVTDVVRLRQVLVNGTLVFKPFRAEDYRQDVHTAVYKCVASNPVGTVVSRDVRVRAVVKQFYKVQVYDEFVIKGNIAVLKCHVPSFVKDYISVTSWLKDDVDIHAYPEAKRFSRLTSGELFIYEVSMEDGSRTYRCKTKHRLTGEIILSSSGRLIVTDPRSSVPPRISHNMGSIMTRVGRTVELPCAAQAYPAPTYRWFKSVGKQLDPVQSTQGTVLLDGQLLLRQAEVQHSGKYVCVVSNTVGEERIETMLTVTAPLSAHIEPREQVIDVGKSASFRCVISGHPVASVSWFKNGRPLTTGEQHNPSRFPTRDVLVIESVQREDRGMYQCFAANDEESTQATAELKLGDAAPELHQTFTENTLNPGPSVSLRCVASGNPTPTFAWTLDGLPLPESKRFQIAEFTVTSGDVVSHVNISRVKVEDGGEYTCTTSNRVGQAHHSARLNVFGIPYIRPMPNVTVVAGHDVTIPCRVAGHPLRSITWERDGAPFPANLRHKAYSNGTLVIHKAERVADRGAYTCVASSEYSQTARRSVWVNIMDPPKIEPFSFPRDLSEDMRARVLCTIVRGDLPITITWMKDGVRLPPDMGIQVHNADEFSSSLTFRSVTAAHRGNYTCTASNAAATVNFTAELLVHVAPRWAVEPKDTHVLAGSVAVLDCQAEGFPTPNVTWMFGGVKMPGDFTTIEAGSFRYRMADNRSLLIEGVRKQDEGYYLCQATNGIGSGLSKPVFLTVNAPPQFSVKHKTQAVRRGDDVSLHCDVRGDYPMEVTWRRSKQRIYPMDDHRFRIKEKAMDASMLSELMIMRAERKDAVTYACQAQNGFGQDEATIQLLVQEAPASPTDLKIISQSSRSVRIGWAPAFDGHSAIANYHVQYKKVGDSWSGESQLATFSGSDSSASVTGLLPGVTYHLRVLAENGLGRSEPSEVVEVPMPEEVPGGPPLAIEVKPTGSDSLRVIWRPPKKELSNGEIIGYYVGYKIYETSEPYHYRTVEVREGFKEELVLTDLRKYTKYSVVVQAYNRMGSGPYSDEVVAFTLEDAPSEPPQGVQCSPLSSQSVQVGWEPPPKTTQNGVIRGYKVLYKPSDDYTDSVEHQSTSVNVKTKLHGLEKFRNYSIVALAYTRAGDGARSDAIFCRTLEDVPGPPADIKALAMSSDAILVTWMPPSSPNGFMTKYVVYSRAVGKDDEPTAKHTVPADSQSYLEIRNLQENRDYEFWVTAFTAVGEGESTRVVTQQPQSRVPARTAAFSDIVQTAWREDVRLSCRTVGIPTPRRIWKSGERVIQSGEKHEVLADGTLLIRNVRSTDSGNFSCYIENIYGKDAVHYVLIVHAPPAAPKLLVVGTTESSILLKWTHHDETSAKIKGYTLSYKREYGEWEEVDIAANEDSFVLNNLHCGSRYQFYITAFNRVGTGEPSAIIPTTTKGSAPKLPQQKDVLVVNSTSVTVLLDNWPDGGCPVLYYVVHYSLKSPTNWMLVSNNVQPRQKELTILDLTPKTWYSFRVVAHNDAGSTVTEFDFATLAYDGTAVLTGLPTRTREEKTFYADLNVVVPIAASILILLVALVMVWMMARRRKKRDYHHRHEYDTGQEAKQVNLDNERKMFLPDKEVLSQQQGAPVELNYDPTLTTRRYHPGNLRTPTRSSDNLQGYQEDICPYATFSLEDCRVEAQENQDVPLHLFTHQDPCERYRQPNNYAGSLKMDTYARVKHRHPQPIQTDDLLQNQETYTTNTEGQPQNNTTTSRSNSKRRREKRKNRAPRSKPPSTEYDSVQSDSEGSEPDVNFYANSLGRGGGHDRNRVPDLIYHTTDSSTSNASSPDEEKRSSRMRNPRAYNSPDPVLPLTSPRDHWWNPVYKMNEFPVTTVPSPNVQETALLTSDYHSGYNVDYSRDPHLELLYQNESTPALKRGMYTEAMRRPRTQEAKEEQKRTHLASQVDAYSRPSAHVHSGSHRISCDLCHDVSDRSVSMETTTSPVAATTTTGVCGSALDSPDLLKLRQDL